jgi:hypothetical protein
MAIHESRLNLLTAAIGLIGAVLGASATVATLVAKPNAAPSVVNLIAAGSGVARELQRDVTSKEHESDLARQEIVRLRKLLEACGAPPSDGVIQWDRTAAKERHRLGQQFPLMCAPNGTIGSVWGSGPYTWDSSICSAAVHAGLITAADGGSVTILMNGPME